MKDGDVFYYIKDIYYSDNGTEHKKFCVFAYHYWKRYEHCFDPVQVFESEMEADERAKELNLTEGY